MHDGPLRPETQGEGESPQPGVDLSSGNVNRRPSAVTVARRSGALRPVGIGDDDSPAPSEASTQPCAWPMAKPELNSLSLQSWSWPRFGRRVSLSFAVATSLGLAVLLVWQSETWVLFARLAAAAFAGTIGFSLFERWPTHPPEWLARWVMQVAAVAVVVPGTLFLLYHLGTPTGQAPFWRHGDRLAGFLLLAASSLLVAPWIALAALVRQKEAIARHQSLAFELERSELSRQALDARLRLLQAQIEPHFLFNTLANVRALVASSSPQAPRVLDNLIAYLRAAVPRLDRQVTTFGDELALIRAYLELMHLRMPDRLTYDIHAAPECLQVLCPPMTLMTPVENAVRHGIDPSEEGGQINVVVQIDDTTCVARVCDTGVGAVASSDGGTGLSSLRERLAAVFGEQARLRLLPVQPHGLEVRIEIPIKATKE